MHVFLDWKLDWTRSWSGPEYGLDQRLDWTRVFTQRLDWTWRLDWTKNLNLNGPQLDWTRVSTLFGWRQHPTQIN